MIEIAKQTIDFYLKNNKVPTIHDIEITDASNLDKKGSIFVTLYKNWEIRGSAGNIKEIKKSIVSEIIENTVHAISLDTRFSPLNLNEASDVKIRIDEITNRKVLKDKEISGLDPVKSWVIAIKKDYEKMVVILPNINPTLLSGDDFGPILKTKLWEKKFNEKDYILYGIETRVESNI